jgi:hypothetical protein
MGGKVSEKLRARSLQERQGLFDDSVPLAQRVLSYFSFYSLLLLIGTTPLGIQRLVVHTLQPFAVAGITRLLSLVMRNPWLSFIPITLGLYALLRHLYRVDQKSRRQQSRIVSAQQRGGSSVHYKRKTILESQPSQAKDPDLETGLTQGLALPDDPGEVSAIELRCAEALNRPLGVDDDEGDEGKDSTNPAPLSSKPSGRGYRLTQPTASNMSAVSRSRTPRPTYRGMFSLPDHDTDEDEATLRKVSQRAKERRASRRTSRRASLDTQQQQQGRKGSLHNSLSTLLRMISMTEDSGDHREEKQREREAVGFDDPEELSDFDSFSSGSRFDYSSDDLSRSSSSSGG